jgi:hypothetical protein
MSGFVEQVVRALKCAHAGRYQRIVIEGLLFPPAQNEMDLIVKHVCSPVLTRRERGRCLSAADVHWIVTDDVG